MTDLWKSCN